MVSDHYESYRLVEMLRLNPCCNGRWSLTKCKLEEVGTCYQVLILVVMEDGL